MRAFLAAALYGLLFGVCVAGTLPLIGVEYGAGEGPNNLVYDTTVVGQSNSSTATVASANLTTANANEIVVVITFCRLTVFSPNSTHAPSVSSITDAGSHLTFTQHAVVLDLNNNANFFNSKVEEWWALASSTVSADAITATFASNCTNGAWIVVIAVKGANTTTPFDPNVALPANSGDITATCAAVTMTTTKKNIFVFVYEGFGAGVTNGTTLQTGWAQNFSLSPASGPIGIGAYQIFSAIQSAVSETPWTCPSNGGGNHYIMFGDALHSS